MEPYIQQRFHPALKIGHTALIAGMKKDVPAHCQQGDIDGACGTYVAAIALAMLGKIPNPATIAVQRSGIAARLWKAAHAIYFDGINSRELYELLVSLDADLTLDECGGKHREVLAFAKAAIAAGNIILLSWRTRKHSEHHWTTVIGVSGKKENGLFTEQAFLCLDPGQFQPDISGYNTRLDFYTRLSGRSKSYIGYWCNGDTEALPITLTGAIAIDSCRERPRNKSRN
jgi:hypothetical protein